jgi:uncharacterized protein DUF2804
MDRLPARGPGVRELGLTLPPERMPLLRRGRLLKRWRYVAVYTPELLLCVGDARIGPVPQRWWAVAEPEGALHERTTIGSGGVRIDGSQVQVRSGDTRIELELEESDGVEIASPSGERDNYIWTRKQANVPVRGRVLVADREHLLNGADAFIDDSAGYHERHTVWKWSAGLGRGVGGEPVAWNFVDGVHDSQRDSERTVWVGGEPREVGPTEFADDLSWVSCDGGKLDFREWSTREARMNVLLLRNSYRQPFGTFSGELPGGLELAEGYGVMEEHDVWW